MSEWAVGSSGRVHRVNDMLNVGSRGTSDVDMNVGNCAAHNGFIISDILRLKRWMDHIS